MTEAKANRFLLIAAFAAIYLIWGSTYVAIRIGIETLPPFLMAGARFFIAGAPLYVILRLRGAARPLPRHWAAATLVGTLMLAGGNGIVTWAEQWVPSGLAAVIIATVPLWMTLLEAGPFGGVGLNKGKIAGLILGLVGVLVLVAPSGSDAGSVNVLGGLALVFAALSWSVGSMLSRSVDLPGSPLTVVSMQMTMAGIVLLSIGSAAGEWGTVDPAKVSAASLVALAYLVVFGSIVALAAYVWLMRVVSATAVSTYAFVNPLVAVLLGWAIAGETLGPRTLVSTGLIVGAVVVLHFARRLDLTPPPFRSTISATWVRAKSPSRTSSSVSAC